MLTLFWLVVSFIGSAETWIDMWETNGTGCQWVLLQGSHHTTEQSGHPLTEITGKYTYTANGCDDE